MQSSIVILNYNSREHTVQCLESPGLRGLPNPSTEIILVDNGSTDGSATTFRVSYPTVKLVESPTNLGFSGGANLGAQHASGDVLVFLNNDTRVESGWLESLLEKLEEPGVACAGSTILSWDGSSVEFAGRPGDAFAIAYAPAENPPPASGSMQDSPIFAASGGALALRRDVFEQAGGFDAQYFLYQEDVDLCWRLWLLGHQCHLAAQSRVFHRGGGSATALSPEFVQALSDHHTLATVFKNVGEENLTRIFPLVFLYLMLRRGSGVGARLFEEAIQRFVDALEIHIVSRAQVQAQRKISDEELFRLAGHPFGFLVETGSFDALERALARSTAFDSRSAESVGRALQSWLQVGRELQSVTESVFALTSGLHERAMALETGWRDRIIAEREAGIDFLREEISKRDQENAYLRRQIEERESQLATVISDIKEPEETFLRQKQELARYRELVGLIDEVSSRLNLTSRLQRPTTGKTPVIPMSNIAGLAQPPSTYDIVCFSIIDWEFRWQRPQQIVSQFADAGHRVFFLSISRVAGETGNRCEVVMLRENVFEVRLSLPEQLNIYGAEIPRHMASVIVEDLRALRNTFNIGAAVSLLQVATWASAAYVARQAFGWSIVYDCMDEWDTFPGMSEALLASERRLLKDADLVLVTGQKLFEKYNDRNTHVVLVRNGADFEHFHDGPFQPVLPDVPRPIIGYFGAIADWFDLELVTKLVRERTSYTVVLVGGVFNVAVETIEHYPNVVIVGQKPYELMPSYLHAFDVCMIPFKVNAITEATDPVKFYEYISQGKPVVATHMPELSFYDGLIYMATDHDDFLGKVDLAVRENQPSLVEARMALAKENTWSRRLITIKQAIRDATPKSSIIVVTFANLQYTRQCLESVFARTLAPNFQVIVVDNASDDGTPEYLRALQREHSNLKVIINDRNLGFARANNQGLELADGEFLVLLNNDTVVPSGWLSKLTRHLNQDDIGLVNAVTNFSGNESKIDVFYADMSGMERFAEEYTRAHDDEIFDIRVAAMYCVAMRRDVYERIGPLDENFGIGMFEDDDYSHRVRVAGYRVVCAEDAFVHHYGQASFKKLTPDVYQAAWEQNQKYFEKKWGQPWQAHNPRRPPERMRPLPERLAMEVLFASISGEHEITRLKTGLRSEINDLRAQIEAGSRYVDELKHLIYLREQTISEIHQSKFWKIAGAYWRTINLVRRRRPDGSPRLTAGTFAPATASASEAPSHRSPSSASRPGNSLAKLRRAGAVLKSIRSKVPTARTDANTIAATSPTVPAAVAYDVICFPIIDWKFRKQRPQHLMSQFAAEGHRVFYVTQQPAPKGSSFELRVIEDRLYELALSGVARDVYVQTMTAKDVEARLAAMAEVRNGYGIGQAVVIVELPFWSPLAFALRESFAWPVVYDCMDFHAGFSTTPKALIELERELLSSADLVTTSSSLLQTSARDLNSNVLLVRNACDFDHFAKSAAAGSPHQREKSRPLIGYYGAIAEWFDSELVAELARRHPEWDFVLVGSTVSADVSALRKLKNVALAGERAYDELPEWLGRFDVAIIPFRRTPLTEATNPVKAYEMLAGGKPVVSVPIPEVAALAPMVRLASTLEEFEKEITEALEFDYEPVIVERRLTFAHENTWASRLNLLRPKIEELLQP